MPRKEKSLGHTLPNFKKASVILCIFIIALLSICLSGCSRYGGSSEVQSKEVLESNIAKGGEHDYVCDYFDSWDFPKFDKKKFREIENLFLENSIYTLPNVKEHAKDAAKYFLEEYYSLLPAVGSEADPDKVTDLLLMAYVHEYSALTGDEWAKYRNEQEYENYNQYMSGKGEQTVEYSILTSSDSAAGYANVGYIKISHFKKNTPEQFRDAVDALELAKVSGIIFDLRGNEGGYIDSAVKSIDYLVSVDQKIVTYKTNKSANQVVRATSTHSLSLPSVVLCDEKTASAAELFVAAMRDYKSKGVIDSMIIGEKTAGKGVMQSSFELSDGSAVSFTTSYYDPPSDKNFHGIGISPTHISEDVEGIADNQLDDAKEKIFYLVQLYGGVLGKSELLANLEKLIAGTQNENFGYFCDYLQRWDFPIFNTEKIKAAQDVYTSFVVPHKSEHNSAAVVATAKATAINFFENYYDKINVSDKEAVAVAIISAWLDEIDEYGQYRSNEEANEYLDQLTGTTYGIGITFDRATREIIQISDGSDAKTKLKIGDIILSVNGVEFNNTDASYNAIMNEFANKNQSIKKISVMRDGECIENISVELSVISKQTVVYKIFTKEIDGKEHKIAYVNIASITQGTGNQFRDMIDNLNSRVNGYVFDLRSNIGGPVEITIDCIDYLVPSGTQLATYQYISDNSVITHTAATKNHIGSSVPCVILCNQYTAASAELFVAAMRDFGPSNKGLLNTYIIGETTQGKGTMQQTTRLFDLSAISFTVAYYYPPSGVDGSFHGVGIVPDEIVTHPNAQYASDIQYERGIEKAFEMLAGK